MSEVLSPDHDLIICGLTKPVAVTLDKQSFHSSFLWVLWMSELSRLVGAHTSPCGRLAHCRLWLSVPLLPCGVTAMPRVRRRVFTSSVCSGPLFKITVLAHSFVLQKQKGNVDFFMDERCPCIGWRVSHASTPTCLNGGEEKTATKISFQLGAFQSILSAPFSLPPCIRFRPFVSTTSIHFDA